MTEDHEQGSCPPEFVHWACRVLRLRRDSAQVGAVSYAGELASDNPAAIAPLRPPAPARTTTARAKRRPPLDAPPPPSVADAEPALPARRRAP